MAHARTHTRMPGVYNRARVCLWTLIHEEIEMMRESRQSLSKVCVSVNGALPLRTASRRAHHEMLGRERKRHQHEESIKSPRGKERESGMQMKLTRERGKRSVSRAINNRRCDENYVDGPPASSKVNSPQERTRCGANFTYIHTYIIWASVMKKKEKKIKKSASTNRTMSTARRKPRTHSTWRTKRLTMISIV